jgi:carbonyl reductase 1
MTKVAIVTGSNKGIGYAIVKQLAKTYEGSVYLTARNEELGQKAVKDLESEGIKVKFHQLDIDNAESISRFAKYLKDTYAGLDLLVNNAAIAFKAADTTSFAEQASASVRVNFTGTLNLCNALFPLLRAHARVVNVASRVGVLDKIKDAETKKILAGQESTVEDIVKVMSNFVELSQTGKNEHITSSAYGMSKAGLIALTRAHQRAFNKDSRADLIVNAMCPGYCDTDMTSHKGPDSPDKGAITALFLANLAADVKEPKGEFWADLKPYDWEAGKLVF